VRIASRGLCSFCLLLLHRGIVRASSRQGRRIRHVHPSIVPASNIIHEHSSVRACSYFHTLARSRRQSRGILWLGPILCGLQAHLLHHHSFNRILCRLRVVSSLERYCLPPGTLDRRYAVTFAHPIGPLLSGAVGITFHTLPSHQRDVFTLALLHTLRHMLGALWHADAIQTLPADLLFSFHHLPYSLHYPSCATLHLSIGQSLG